MLSRVAIVILAAGRATRMSGFNKLLSTIGNVPLVRISTAEAVYRGEGPVIVVTGHMAHEIRNAVTGLSVTVVHNDECASGMSSSVRAALRAIPEDCNGMLIHLADMPLVTRAHLASMIEAFTLHEGIAIVRATAFGRFGNPVIVPRSLFSDLSAIDGDVGAREVISKSGVPIVSVEIGHVASFDVDTIDDLKAAGGDLGAG